jgi:6-phosphogluconolactonase
MPAEARPRIIVYPTVAALQAAAAERALAILRRVTRDGDARIALSGGSTPRRFHELLAAAEGVDWSRVHVYWGDERAVGPDDEQSNYRMARETLLDHVPLPPANVHRMQGELPAAEAASAYEELLRETFKLSAGQLPRFDLLVLGMGADGHTASLFPGTDALEERERLVVANHVPQLETTRITLTYPVLNAAAHALFLVAGADKAAALQCVFRPVDAERPPAALVQPTDGAVTWLVDEAAAALLGDRG